MQGREDQQISGVGIESEEIVGTPTIKMASNFWIQWTEIALEQTRLARDARQMAEVTEAGSKGLGEAFNAELKASLVAVAAAAFALEAWAAALEREKLIELPPSVTDNKTERDCRSGRGERMTVLLNAGFDPGSDALERWDESIPKVFHLRNRAVHHKSRFYETEPHPTGKSHVSKENAIYTAEAAEAAAKLAVEVVTACIESPRRELGGLVMWCNDRAHVPVALAEKRKQELGE